MNVLFLRRESIYALSDLSILSSLPDLRRVTNILAPEGFHVVLTFFSFHLYTSGPYCDAKECCYFDSLEIRTEAPFREGDV